MPGCIPWNDVAEDWEPEGAWREAYVLDTSIGEWQRVVEAVQARWPSSFWEDGEPRDMPRDLSEIFSRAADHFFYWQISLSDDVRVFCSYGFYSAERIEFGFSPGRSTAKLNWISFATSFV